MNDHVKFVWRTALALFALAALSACDSSADRTLEETVEQTYQVSPTASITVKNTEGSIRIYGSSTNEVSIEAVKKAYNRERLTRIAIDVSAQPDAILIDTKYPPKPKWGFFDRSGTVDYVILVPQSCNIKALELTNGEVSIEGMRGKDVHASLVNGRLWEHNCFSDNVRCTVATGGLDVSYDWWEKDRKFSVNAKITDGNASAFIPGDADFHLVAATEDGNVSSEFTDLQDRGPEVVQKVDKLVGGAHSDAEVRIEAVSGSIRIAEANP